jgi:hypothetical protein
MVAVAHPQARPRLVRCRFAPHLRRLDDRQRRQCAAAALRALARLAEGYDIYFLPFRVDGARFALSARCRPGRRLIEVEIAALDARVPWRLITESEARIAAARRHPRR